MRGKVQRDCIKNFRLTGAQITRKVTAQAMPILPPHPLNPPLPNAALRLVEGENDLKPTPFAPLPGLKARLREGLG